MNTKIKEFIEQAHTYSFQMNRGQLVLNDFADRFAELIVRECIRLNGKELAMPGHSRMVDVYCEHFGIEL